MIVTTRRTAASATAIVAGITRRMPRKPHRIAIAGRLIEANDHQAAVARYQGRVSGPLLDRIDLHVEVPALSPAELLEAPAGEPTASVQSRCTQARERSVARQGKANHALHGAEIDRQSGAMSAGP